MFSEVETIITAAWSELAGGEQGIDWFLSVEHHGVAYIFIPEFFHQSCSGGDPVVRLDFKWVLQVSIALRVKEIVLLSFSSHQDFLSMHRMLQVITVTLYPLCSVFSPFFSTLYSL